MLAVVETVQQSLSVIKCFMKCTKSYSKYYNVIDTY